MKSSGLILNHSELRFQEEENEDLILRDVKPLCTFSVNETEKHFESCLDFYLQILKIETIDLFFCHLERDIEETPRRWSLVVQDSRLRDC